MGTLKNCYANSGDSVEIAVIRRYDETQARVVTATNPGFDDLLGEPLYEDLDDDGVGERTRPELEIEIKCKVKWTRNEEQRQDGTGNAPTSLLTLRIADKELENVVPSLLVDGEPQIRPNDRLLRIQSQSGKVRHTFEADGRDGVHCFEVRPGETGTGIHMFLFENRRPVQRR